MDSFGGCHLKWLWTGIVRAISLTYDGYPRNYYGFRGPLEKVQLTSVLD